MKPIFHKRVAVALAMLCAVLLTVPALAAPGDANAFVYPEGTPREQTKYARFAVPLNDAFYVMGSEPTGEEGMDAQFIYKWQTGDAEPAKLCPLPSYPTGYWGSYERATPEVQKQLDEQVSHITVGDGKLWAYNNYTGRFGEITEQGVQWAAVKLDMTGMTQGEGEDQYPRNVYSLLVDGGTLYLLRDGYEDGHYQQSYTLVCFDMQSGAQRKYQLTNARLMTQYKPGQLLTLGSKYDESKNETVTALTVVDMATGTETPLALELPKMDYNYGGLAYDAQTDSILYTYQGQIWRSTAGAPFAGVAYLSMGYIGEESRAFLLPGNIYFLSNGGLYLRNVDPQYKPAQALRIQGGWDDQVYRGFTQANPDIPVLLLEGWSGNSEDISKAIASGDTQVDIYITNVSSGLQPLIQKGYTADLSGSEIIARDIASMYPAIQAAVSDKNGRPMAYPREMYMSTWSLNRALWDELDMGDVPTTYEQLIDLMLLWQEDYDEEYSEYMVLSGYTDKGSLAMMVIEGYIRMYENPDQPIDFKSPVLRSVLEKVEQLDMERPDYENMSESDWEEYNEQMNRPALINTWSGGGMFYDPNTTQYVSSNTEDRFRNGQGEPMLPLVFEEGQQARIPTQLEVFFINPASPHKELALKYLEYAVQDTKNPTLRYAIHPNLNEPLEYEDFEQTIKDMETWRKNTEEGMKNASEADKRSYQDSLDYIDRWMQEKEKNKWQISAKAIESYRAVAPYMDFAAESMYQYGGEDSAISKLYQIQERYNQGQINLDGFLKELDNKMKMMFLEGK